MSLLARTPSTSQFVASGCIVLLVISTVSVCTGAFGFAIVRGVLAMYYKANFAKLDFQVSTIYPSDTRKVGQTDIRIDKVIHQTYKSLEEVPLSWQESPRQWKSIMGPRWEYMFWSDHDSRELIRTDFPWFLNTFDAYKHPIQRADAIRYFVVYKYGGVYCDMDVAPYQDITALLVDADVVLMETPNLGITNWFMAARRGTKFFECLIHQLESYASTFASRNVMPETSAIMVATGPTFVWGMLGACEYEDEIRILDKDHGDSCSVCDANVCGAARRHSSWFQFLVHRLSSSWHEQHEQKNGWFLFSRHQLLCSAHLGALIAVLPWCVALTLFVARSKAISFVIKETTFRRPAKRVRMIAILLAQCIWAGVLIMLLLLVLLPLYIMGLD